jgi:hypothetical protein
MKHSGRIPSIVEIFLSTAGKLSSIEISAASPGASYPNVWVMEARAWIFDLVFRPRQDALCEKAKARARSAFPLATVTRGS